jgi:hypothetical protein
MWPRAPDHLCSIMRKAVRPNPKSRVAGLVYILVIGTPDRFPCGKQIGRNRRIIPK